MKDLTWTCHVCGLSRPDEQIAVRSTTYVTERGVIFEENVRYCRDRPECVEGSRSVRFTPIGEPVEKEGA